MLFATALKDGVTGPDFTGKKYTYKNGEQRIITEDQRGYYDQIPDCFSLVEFFSMVGKNQADKLVDKTGNQISIGSSSVSKNNTIGTFRPYGAGGQTVEGQGYANTIAKIPAKAPFSRVRLLVMRRDIVPLTSIRALVAATSDTTAAAIANAYHPRSGSTSYNSMSAQNSQAEGWKTVTFGGNSVYDANLYGGTGQEASYDPSGSYASAPDIIASDWIRVRSLSPANLLMLRLAMTGGAIDSSVISSQPSANGFFSVNNGGDATVLTNLPGSVPSGTGQFPYVAIEFDHEVPVRNFLCVGDSNTEGYSWNHNAINGRSTTEKPVYSINMGASSHRWEEFTAIALQYMKKTKNITDVLLPTFSTNDSSEVLDSNFTRFGEDIQIARVQRFIDLCNTAGIKVWLWTHFAGYVNAASGSNDFRNVNINNWARRVCAQGKATLVDIQAGWDRTTHLSGDNTHPNAAGIAYMEGVLTAALQAEGV